jgi:predicted RNA binding protein YcfA (HicA-like mRNA interferase family)
VSRLKLIDFRTMDRLLRKLGFEISRQKGSHVFYRHPDGRTTVVPNHGSKDLARPLIADILKDIGLTVDQYQNELDSL